MEYLGIIKCASHQHASERPKSRGPAIGALFSLATSVVTFSFVITGAGVSDRLNIVGPAMASSQSTEFAAGHMAPVALIDVSGDGIPDFANPTGGQMRGEDNFGSGEFGAARDGGRRKHEGTDYVAAPAAPVYAPITGMVTKLGYAYDRNVTLRFVEVTNFASSLVSRVLYVDSTVKVGDQVIAGDRIGAAEDLSSRYRGITNHVHVQLATNGVFLDPANVLPSAPMQMASAQPEAKMIKATF